MLTGGQQRMSDSRKDMKELLQSPSVEWLKSSCHTHVSEQRRSFPDRSQVAFSSTNKQLWYNSPTHTWICASNEFVVHFCIDDYIQVRDDRSNNLKLNLSVSPDNGQNNQEMWHSANYWFYFFTQVKARQYRPWNVLKYKSKKTLDTFLCKINWTFITTHLASLVILGRRRAK